MRKGFWWISLVNIFVTRYHSRMQSCMTIFSGFRVICRKPFHEISERTAEHSWTYFPGRRIFLCINCNWKNYSKYRFSYKTLHVGLGKALGLNCKLQLPIVLLYRKYNSFKLIKKLFENNPITLLIVMLLNLLKDAVSCNWIHFWVVAYNITLSEMPLLYFIS